MCSRHAATHGGSPNVYLSIVLAAGAMGLNSIAACGGDRSMNPPSPTHVARASPIRSLVGSGSSLGTAPSARTSQPSAIAQANEEAVTSAEITPRTLSIVINPNLPAQVLLDQEGLVTPVKDQGGRTGAGSVFAAIGLLESEYLVQYGVTFDLSEEYLINAMNESRPLDWTGGDAGEKLFIASYYGVAPTSQWPYIASTSSILSLAREVVPGSPASDTDLETLLSGNLLDRDLANYSVLTFPPQSVHETAMFAPVQVVQIPDVTNVTALETTIANGDAIAIGAATGTWQQDPATGVFNYNAAGDATVDHALLLVGYDQDQQTFRVKNSWGTGWGGCNGSCDGGFADFSFDLVTNTANYAYYISGLEAPGNTNMGAGAWLGFWNAQLNGVSGVAVLRQAYGPQSAGGGSFSEGLGAVGTFYGQDGSTTSVPKFLGGNALSALFGDDGSSGSPAWTVTLQRTAGAQTAVANGGESTWYKCNPEASGSYHDYIAPTGYSQAATDSYVLPPCNVGSATPPSRHTCTTFAQNWVPVFNDPNGTYGAFGVLLTASTGDVFAAPTFWGLGNDVWTLKLPFAQNTVASAGGIQPWVPADVMGMPAEWNSTGAFAGSVDPLGNIFIAAQPASNSSSVSGWWLRRSKDNGVTWAMSDQYMGADVGQAYAGAVGVTSDGTNAFATGWATTSFTDFHIGIGVVRQSADRGDTWKTTYTYSNPNGPGAFFQEIVPMPNGALEMIGGSYDTSLSLHALLFQSLDHGSTWTLVLDHHPQAGQDTQCWRSGLPDAAGNLLLDCDQPDVNSDGHWQVLRIALGGSSPNVSIVDDVLLASGQGSNASSPTQMFRDGNGTFYVPGWQVDSAGHWHGIIRHSPDGATWGPLLDYPGGSGSAGFYGMGQDTLGNLYAVGWDGSNGLILALPCLVQ
jgi:Papain family cysteine protease